jgi:hypothetical protein
MSQANTAQVMNLFKKVYGGMTDLQPEDYQLQRDIPYTQKQRVGESYNEAVVLTAETGITFAGSGSDAFTLSPAIAGAVKQATITPYVSVLGSVVPWSVMSRSATSEGAFMQATKHVVRNNVKSHGRFLEIVRLYGQAIEKLGYVSYATATYRGVALVTGTGTVNGVAFTNGVAATEKAILMAPGQFASGIWVGMEGVKVLQLDSTNAIVAQGKLTGVDSDYGILYVDFTPVAASSTTSHKMAFDGMELGNEALGIKAILQNTGSLFGISTSAYSLWKGNNIALSNVKFTFDRLNTGVSAAVNRGGLDGDLYVYVNPRTWGTLISTEAGRRQYDDNYTPTEAKNGFEAIVFHSQNGKCVIQSHRIVKEGDVLGLALEDWSRSGSAEVGFTVPSSGNGEIIFPLENQAGYAFRSYSDQYVFNHAPARSIIWTGVNDEAAS